MWTLAEVVKVKELLLILVVHVSIGISIGNGQSAFWGENSIDYLIAKGDTSLAKVELLKAKGCGNIAHVHDFILLRLKLVEGNSHEALDFLSKSSLADSGDSTCTLVIESECFRAFLLSRIGLVDSAMQVLTDVQPRILGSPTHSLRSRYYQILGNVLMQIGQSSQAFEEYESAYNASLEEKDSMRITSVLVDLAGIDYRLKDFQGAKSKYSEALEFYNRFQLRQKSAKILRNKSAVLLREDAAANASEIDSLLDQSLALSKSVGDSITIGNTLLLRATFLAKQKKPILNKQYLDSAQYYFEIISYTRGLAKCAANLGNWHYRARDLKSAREVFENSLAIAKDANDLPLQVHILSRLTRISEKQGRIEDAYVWINERIKVESLVDEMKEKAILAYANARFESARKDRMISRQREENLFKENRILQQKQTIWIVGLAAFFLVGIFIIGFQLQRNKRRTAQNAALAAEESADRKVSDLLQQHRYDKLVATIQGEESERDRLAKEVHDGVGGTLSGIAMQLESKDAMADDEKRKELAGALREAHDDLRNIAHNLSIPAIENNTLVELIGNLLNNVQSNHPLKVSLVVFPTDVPFDLDSQLEIGMYRITQEAINNIIKHAGASTLDVQITKHDEGLELMIEDDGSGFELNSTSGIGLKNIKERAEVFGGQLNIDSHPGRGTVISVSIPSNG